MEVVDMIIKVLAPIFSICKLSSLSHVVTTDPFYFFAQTDEELSLVCEQGHVPKDALIQNDGWKAMRIEGTLDFSLVGILANVSAILAEHHISIFAISTYNTDYILVKQEELPKAISVLETHSYTIRKDG